MSGGRDEPLLGRGRLPRGAAQSPTPHHEFDPQVPGGYAWIASGQVISTSTGPSHSAWIAAGETLFRR